MYEQEEHDPVHDLDHFQINDRDHAISTVKYVGSPRDYSFYYYNKT